MPNSNFDEYPEISAEDLDRASFKVAGKTVDKATWQQTVRQLQTQHATKKKRISIHLDSDIIEYFKAQADGKGYQTLINQTLRQLMNA